MCICRRILRKPSHTHRQEQYVNLELLLLCISGEILLFTGKEKHSLFGFAMQWQGRFSVSAKPFLCSSLSTIDQCNSAYDETKGLQAPTEYRPSSSKYKTPKPENNLDYMRKQCPYISKVTRPLSRLRNDTNYAE